MHVAAACWSTQAGEWRKSPRAAPTQAARAEAALGRLFTAPQPQGSGWWARSAASMSLGLLLSVLTDANAVISLNAGNQRRFRRRTSGLQRDKGVMTGRRSHSVFLPRSTTVALNPESIISQHKMHKIQ